MKTKSNIFSAIGLTLTATAVISLSSACSGKSTPMEPASTEQRDSTAADSLLADSSAVQVDAVSSATHVENSPTFNGLMVVQPQQHATLSLTMGGRVHSILVMPGQSVHKGQVVATIDNPEFIELQQEYLDAAAQLEYLEKEYERQKSLGSQEASSKKKIEQSKADYLSMKSRKAAASARLTALGVHPAAVQQHGISAFLQVKSPIAGYVTNLQANLGKYLQTGEPICDVINKAEPLLQLTVYEKEIGLMKVGTPLAFRVNGMGKETFSATVVAIEQSVDKTDYSIKVYARVTTPNTQFRPGMYVRSKIKAQGNSI